MSSAAVGVYDAIIVGAGPAGITAAMYLNRSGCTVALVEKLTPGGQVLQTEVIENYPGFPNGIKGYELADTFAAHIAPLAIDRFAEGVGEMLFLQSGKDGQSHIHRVHVGDKWIEARTVIIASGAAHKHLGLPEELRYSGKGVSYCAICDGNFYRGQDVAVVGGGNSALEEALYLAKIARKVYVIHRRETFRGAKVYVDRLEATENVEIIRNSVVSKITGFDTVDGVVVQNVQDKSTKNLSVQGFFIFVGIKPNVDFIPAELQRDAAGFLITDTEMRTNIPGVFAAGDIRAKLCRQVSTAVGDGATAAQAAFLYMEQL